MCASEKPCKEPCMMCDCKSRPVARIPIVRPIPLTEQVHESTSIAQALLSAPYHTLKDCPDRYRCPWHDPFASHASF